MLSRDGASPPPQEAQQLLKAEVARRDATIATLRRDVLTLQETRDATQIEVRRGPCRGKRAVGGGSSTNETKG